MRRVIEYGGLSIPSVTAGEMERVDDRMMNVYGVHLLQMMENAGAALATLAVHLVPSGRRARRITVVAGAGGNGGGGLAAARRLAAWGWPVEVWLATAMLQAVPQVQHDILQNMGVPVLLAESQGWRGMAQCLASSRLVIDALLGYRVAGPAHGGVAALIQRINQGTAPVLALDVPSGLDPTTGVPTGPAIQATATLMLALPKCGLLEVSAAPYCGDLYLADIGIPCALYTLLGISVPAIFQGEPYIALAASP